MADLSSGGGLSWLIGGVEGTNGLLNSPGMDLQPPIVLLIATQNRAANSTREVGSSAASHSYCKGGARWLVEAILLVEESEATAMVQQVEHG